MRNAKRTLLITGSVLAGLVVCVLVLREAGILDVHLYKSALSASQFASKSDINPGPEKHFSYTLTIKRGSQVLERSVHTWDNLPQMEIEAVIEEPVYSGSYSLPFVKSFTMTYRCTFDTTSSPTARKISGEIKGEVKATFHGLCTTGKAKELAFGEAKKQVASYLRQQLDM